MSNEKPLTTGEATTSLDELNQEVARLQRSIRLAIQAQLGKLAGRSMADIDQNRQLVESIHQLLESHALRVRCSECGHPAILRVSPRPGSSVGVFVFDHTIEGKRTFHGGRGAVPLLQLVAKPPRKNSTKRAAS
jgi:hypothetical protein